LACSVLGSLVMGCSPLDLDERAAPQEVPPVTLRGVVVEGWNEGVRDLSLRADQASIDLATRVAGLDRVTISLSGAEARQLEVKAPRGEFDLQHDALRLLGGVEGHTRPGERFTTEELHYEQETGRLRSEKPVHIQRPNLDLSAHGMEVDLGARRVRLHGSVRAELRSE